MANSKKSVRLVAVNSNLYKEDDIPNYVAKLQELNKTPERQSRIIKRGTVVIILEGEFAGRRAVYLNRTDNFEAVLCGLSVPLIKIDEQYILSTSTHINISEIKFNETEIFKSEKIFTELYKEKQKSDIQMKIESEIENIAVKTKFMKTYLMSDFTVPSDINPFEFTY